MNKNNSKKMFLQTSLKAVNFEIKNICDELHEKYNEPHRHYHNIEHIHDCLEKTRFLNLSEEESIIIELAIWFHDIIYNPILQNNEEMSSNYFVVWANKINLPAYLIERISFFILSTKNHDSIEEDELLKEFLDIDLSILAAESSKFVEYENSIRREYSFVPDSIFYPKRKELLRNFLNKEFIFKSLVFRDLYEDKARSNLNKLLNKDKKYGRI